MSSSRYIPLVRRARKALDELEHMMRDERLARCSALRWLGEKTDREPSLLASAMSLLLMTVVLLNPNDIAPCIANGIGMIPAWRTFRLIASREARLVEPAETDAASKKLLDYSLVMGTSIFVEQLLGHAMLTRMVPFWWIMKAAVVLWFLMRTGEHEMSGFEAATSPQQVSVLKSSTLVTNNTIQRSAESGLWSRRNGQVPLDLALQSPHDLAEPTLESSPTKSLSPVSEAVDSPTESAGDTASSEDEEDPFGEDFDEQSIHDDASPPITPSSPVKLSQNVLEAPSPISEASLSPLSPPIILPSAAPPPEPLPEISDTPQLAVPAAGEIRRMSLDELLEMAKGEEENLAMGSSAGGKREDMEQGGQLVAAR